ncbi:MAG: aldolase/citrate lyase family protein [Acidobacteria bacterium]|nr:aldolase/citrate lyase family protein [Acidobacteriota bacterium]MCI0724516.1 aldolase/citrate lyase family protein [Acidobacteriota bacterium]
MKAKIERKKVLWGASVTRVPAAPIVELYGMMGLDFVWIDMEHSDFSFRDLSALTCAARSVGISPLVRIAENDPKRIMKSLECGADGLVIPDVRNAEEAGKIVQAAKFFPLGMRGLAGSDIKSRYGLVDLKTYMAQTNNQTLLVAQIEHKDAVQQAEKIASIDGIDLLFVGRMDLSQSFGQPGQMTHPLVDEATVKVAAACKNQGKGVALAVGSPEDAKKAISLGARFLVIASEMSLMRARLQEVLSKYREASGNEA